MFTFQEGFNPSCLENEHNFEETKKSSLMSPLRESDLKNSVENSSGIVFKSIEKPPGTPVSDFFADSDKPSSSFNRAFLTLEELKPMSGIENFFKNSSINYEN